MTPPELVTACRRAGFAVVYDRDKGPRVKPTRPGAVLNPRLEAQLRANRQALIDWFDPPEQQPGVCPVCKADVFEPGLVAEVCEIAGGRGPGRCQYKPGARDYGGRD